MLSPRNREFVECGWTRVSQPSVFIRIAGGTSFDMKISEVSAPRNSDSVALRPCKSSIFNKHLFSYRLSVYKPHFERHKPRGLGEGGGGSSLNVERWHLGWAEFGLCPGGEPSRLSKQGSDSARSAMEINCSHRSAGHFLFASAPLDIIASRALNK